MTATPSAPGPEPIPQGALRLLDTDLAPRLLGSMPLLAGSPLGGRQGVAS